MQESLFTSQELETSPPQKSLKILLIGETCIDEYIYGSCIRLSPEAPVPVLVEERSETLPGMAANVKCNLEAFGFHVDFLTQKEPIIKTRYVDSRFHHQILRVDKEPIVTPLAMETRSRGTDVDAIVVSDYDKGFISLEDLKTLSIIAGSMNVPLFIDSKKPQVTLIKDAFIKINDEEFGHLVGPWYNDKLIRTRGSKGADYANKNYPAETVNVFDVCGAGDTFLAALVYKYWQSGDITEAIPFANKAAAIAVSHFGTYVLTQEDIDAICD